ncbi:hypothetical protein QR680_000041 [Steinernema hermaphroditum]|uniref:FHA domain-containing protein n=1 Tax=Steinernema hermaphroditum TaxID=289476 RepID=A0AA39GV19_9BILA|nr:hypothetical protein QR680_000041 [Steinernema hermaphroditum]
MRFSQYNNDVLSADYATLLRLICSDAFKEIAQSISHRNHFRYKSTSGPKQQRYANGPHVNTKQYSLCSTQPISKLTSTSGTVRRDAPTARFSRGVTSEGVHHLRRIYFDESHRDAHNSECLILLDVETKIGRNPEVVDVVLTSHQYSFSNMISRDHSVIHGQKDASGRFVRYTISDNSLNGTYINDYRVKDAVDLHDNDIIKFGHVNGAAIKAGEHAPQYKAEFAFVFEKAYASHKYPGFNLDYHRVKPPGSHNHSPFMSITSGNQQPLLFRDPAAAALAGLMPMASRTSAVPQGPSAPLLVPKPSRDPQPPPRPPPSPVIQAAPTTTTAPSTSTSGSLLAEQILAGTANRPSAFPYFPISSPFPFWAAWPGTPKGATDATSQWNQQLAAAATGQSTPQPNNPLQAAAAAVAAYQTSMGVDYATACAAMGLRPQPIPPPTNGDTNDLATCVRNVHNRAAQQNANQVAVEARAAEAARFARQPLPSTNLQTITGFAQNMHTMTGVRELQAALAAQQMGYPFSTTASLLIGNGSDALGIGTQNLQSKFPMAQQQPISASPTITSSRDPSKPIATEPSIFSSSANMLVAGTSFRQIHQPSPPTVASPIPHRPTNCLPHSVANALGVSTATMNNNLSANRRPETVQNESKEKAVTITSQRTQSPVSVEKPRIGRLAIKREITSPSVSDTATDVNVPMKREHIAEKEPNTDQSAESSTETPPSNSIERPIKKEPKTALDVEIPLSKADPVASEPPRTGSSSPSHRSISSHSPIPVRRIKSPQSGNSRSVSPSLKEESRSASPAHSHQSNPSIHSIRSLESNPTSSNQSSSSPVNKRALVNTSCDEEPVVKAKKSKADKPAMRHKQNDLSRLLSDLDGSFMHQAALSSRRSGARTNATRLESLQNKNKKPSSKASSHVRKSTMKQISDDSSMEESDDSDSSLPSVRAGRLSKNGRSPKGALKQSKNEDQKRYESSTCNEESDNESEQSSVDVKSSNARNNHTRCSQSQTSISPMMKPKRANSAKVKEVFKMKGSKKKAVGRPRKKSRSSWEREDSSEGSDTGTGDDEEPSGEKSSSSSAKGGVWGYHDAERDDVTAVTSGTIVSATSESKRNTKKVNFYAAKRAGPQKLRLPLALGARLSNSHENHHVPNLFADYPASI